MKIFRSRLKGIQMRNLFPGHYRPTDEQFTELWQNAVFVLDANVLLNLYRYPSEARDDLLAVFRRVSDRLWLPHQAALEYQWNRPGEIAEQVKKYNEVRKIVQNTASDLTNQLSNLNLKKRHSTIKTDQLTKDVGDITVKFLDELKALESQQPDVSEDDKIRDEIDQLFASKVGNAPQSQEQLDEIYKEGEDRYKRHCPPGYLDSVKSKDQIEVYTHNGLVFRRDYGDLILWHEIIEEAKVRNLNHIIFVTDDEKEDWWWKKDSRGKRTLGARPELIEELKKKAGVSLFYMYTSRGFIKWAKTYLDVQVKDESIEQIRDISRLNQRNLRAYTREQAEDAVARWVDQFHENYEMDHRQRGFPDIIAVSPKDGSRIGYETIYASDPVLASIIVRDRIYRAYYEIGEKHIDRAVVVFPADSEEEMNRLEEQIRRRYNNMNLHEHQISFQFGTLQLNDIEGGILEFIPVFG